MAAARVAELIKQIARCDAEISRIDNEPDIYPAWLLALARSDWETEKEFLQKEMREFQSGATRDSDDGKLDFEGFLCPLVLERFAQYMNVHRRQADGQIRASDNWQRGIPKDAYMKSMWRHFHDVWKAHRGVGTIPMDEALCAVLFNAMGLLHEVIKCSAGYSSSSPSSEPEQTTSRTA